jgi:hypothetical protein
MMISVTPISRSFLPLIPKTSCLPTVMRGLGISLEASPRRDSGCKPFSGNFNHFPSPLYFVR